MRQSKKQQNIQLFMPIGTTCERREINMMSRIHTGELKWALAEERRPGGEELPRT